MSIFDDKGKNVLAYLKALGENPDDPIAEKVSWNNMYMVKYDFHSHRITYKGKKQLLIKKSVEVDLFTKALLIICGVLLIYQIVSQSQYVVFTFVLSLGLIFGGLLALYFKEYTFDKKYHYFWEGNKNIAQLRKDEKKKLLKLESIHALQILSKKRPQSNKKDNTDTYTFELNLVLDSAERIHLFANTSRADIEESAKKISTFLEIPIWNGIM